MADAVLIWCDFNSALSLILLLVLPRIYWHFRDKEMIRIRIPSLCIVEMVLDLILLLTISTQYGSLIVGWNPFPCWLVNFLSYAINALLFNVSLARIVLFYKLAQGTVLEYSENSKTKWKIRTSRLDSFVRWIGYAVAPAEFERLDNRNRLGSGSLGMSRSSSNSSISKSSMAPTEFTAGEYDEQSRRDFDKWILKLTAWFCVWTVVSLIVTFGIDGGTVMGELYGTSPTECGIGIFQLIGYHLIIWNIGQLLIITQIVQIQKDPYGLRAELIVVQFMFCLTWGMSGVMQAFFPDLYGSIGVWIDLSAILIHALITFSVPVGLTILDERRRHRESIAEKTEKSPSGAILRSEADLERMWSTELGRTAITKILTSHFSTENTLFLLETDPFLGGQNKAPITTSILHGIYTKFIKRSSAFELNLPSDIAESFHSAVKSSSGGEEELKKCRSHIMYMILSNFQREIAQELKSSGEPGSSTLATASV